MRELDSFEPSRGGGCRSERGPVPASAEAVLRTHLNSGPDGAIIAPVRKAMVQSVTATAMDAFASSGDGEGIR